MKVLLLGFALSLAACATDEPDDVLIDVADEKSDSTSACTVVAKPLHAFEADELPLSPSATKFTEGVRMRRAGLLGKCERIEAPWFRIDNTSDAPVRVQAKLGGIDKIFLKWLVRKVDADGKLLVQAMTPEALAPHGIELTGVIDGGNPEYATTTLAPGERLETIAVPNAIGSRGFGWFPLPTFYISRLP
jgi:hypothetical protein